MAKVIVRAGKIGFVLVVSIFCVALLLYGFDLFVAAQIESEEVAGIQGEILDEAQSFRKSDQIPEADAIYRRIMAEQPGTSAALDAARERVLMYIEADDGVAAQQSVEDLATGFASAAGYPKALLDIGDKFRQVGKIEQSQAMYHYLLDAYPLDENTIWTRMGLAIADIQGNHQAEAQGVTADILTAYAEDERTGNAACQIGDAWRKQGRFAEAKTLYRYVIEQRPDTELALWSQMGLVISDLALKNEPNAAVGVQDLLKKHSKDKRIANAACQIADRYQEAGDGAMSKALYNYVVSAWPKEEHAIWCQKGLAVLEEKTDPNSTAQLDRLLTNFAGHANLPLAAFLVGEKYRDAAMKRMEEGKYEEAAKGYQKAVDAWDRIIQMQPETDYTPEAYYILAECCYMAGQYDRAIYNYQYVAERWPDFKLAWHSQFMVGYRYQQLKQAGLVEGKTADLQMAAAYKAVLVADPNCPAAKAATDWLRESGN